MDNITQRCCLSETVGPQGRQITVYHNRREFLKTHRMRWVGHHGNFQETGKSPDYYRRSRRQYKSYWDPFPASTNSTDEPQRHNYTIADIDQRPCSILIDRNVVKPSKKRDQIHCQARRKSSDRTAMSLNYTTRTAAELILAYSTWSYDQDAVQLI